MNSKDESVLSAIAETVRVALLSGELASLPGLGRFEVRHLPSREDSDIRGTVVTAPAAVIHFDADTVSRDDTVLPRAAEMLTQNVGSVQTSWQSALNRLSSSRHLTIPGVCDLVLQGMSLECIVSPSLQMAVNARYTGYVDLAILRGADRVAVANTLDVDLDAERDAATKELFDRLDEDLPDSDDTDWALGVIATEDADAARDADGDVVDGPGPEDVDAGAWLPDDLGVLAANEEEILAGDDEGFAIPESERAPAPTSLDLREPWVADPESATLETDLASDSPGADIAPTDVSEGEDTVAAAGSGDEAPATDEYGLMGTDAGSDDPARQAGVGDDSLFYGDDAFPAPDRNDSTRALDAESDGPGADEYSRFGSSETGELTGFPPAEHDRLDTSGSAELGGYGAEGEFVARDESVEGVTDPPEEHSDAISDRATRDDANGPDGSARLTSGSGDPWIMDDAGSASREMSVDRETSSRQNPRLDETRNPDSETPGDPVAMHLEPADDLSLDARRRRGFAVPLAVLSVVGIVMFAGYFLFVRQPSNDRASANPTAPQETEVAPPPAVVEPESPAARTAAFVRGAIDASQGGFTIIVASEPTETAAGAIAAALNVGDTPVDVLEATVDGETRFRVAVGQFRTFALASQALNQNAATLPDGSWIGRIE